MDAEDAVTIGQRLRLVRHAKGKSLAVVAGLAGITSSQLRRLESGERAADRRSLIVALAHALQIAPSDLTVLPMPAPGDGAADAAVAALQHALLAVRHDRPGGRVLPVEALRDRTQRLREARHRGGFTEVGTALPSLIRDLHASIGAGRDGDALLTLAVGVHVHLTQRWLRDAGAQIDLRLQVATLARDIAHEHGDATTLGVAAFGTANTLLAAGMFDLAQAELDSTVPPGTTPETVGLVGMLHLTSSLLAAAGNRPADIAAPMEAATELAERPGCGEDDRLGFGFGPTNVGLWRMALALEAGEHDRAVRIAQRVNPQRHPFATRRATYWVDHGRALARLWGRRDEAVRALRTAEGIFPARVHRNPFARDVLGELLVRARQDAVGRELRGMASRAGLPG